MPVYLFTHHANGNWTPDREQGFVARKSVALPASQPTARLYHGAMRRSGVAFSEDHQRRLIDLFIDSQLPQRFRCFGVATDTTHLLALVAWDDPRNADDMHARIQSSLSQGLNQEFGHGEWLSEGGSHKRVRNRTHFNYLLEHYLPKHSGVAWTLARGFLGSRCDSARSDVA